jgi:hypothetical protein
MEQQGEEIEIMTVIEMRSKWIIISIQLRINKNLEPSNMGPTQNGLQNILQLKEYAKIFYHHDAS